MARHNYGFRLDFLGTPLIDTTLEGILLKAKDIIEKIPPRTETSYGVLYHKEGRRNKILLVLTTIFNSDGSLSWSEPREIHSESLFVLKNVFLEDDDSLLIVNEYPIIPSDDKEFFTFITNTHSDYLYHDKLLINQQQEPKTSDSLFVKNLGDIDFFLERMWEKRKQETFEALETVSHLVQEIERDNKSFFFLLESNFDSDFLDGLFSSNFEAADAFLFDLTVLKGVPTKHQFKAKTFSMYSGTDESALYRNNTYREDFFFDIEDTTDSNPHLIEEDYIDNNFGVYLFTKKIFIKKEALTDFTPKEFLECIRSLFSTSLNKFLSNLKLDYERLSKPFSYAYIEQNFLELINVDDTIISEGESL